MKIPSGKTDIYLYFVAISATTGGRMTGLVSGNFTISRSRNGGAAVAYTTPTVVEVSAALAPGAYALLIDEDTTINSTSDSEEYVVHIAASGMEPVTRALTLFRRTVTTNRTLSVDADSFAQADIQKVNAQDVAGAGSAGDPWGPV